MAELPQVVPGEPVQSTTFGNPVIERVISRYPDATARDFAVPLPQSGDPAYLTATDELQIYNGAEWETYAIDAEKVNIAGDTMTGPLVMVSGSKVEGAGQLHYDLSRTDVPAYWRFAIDADGNLVLQGGDDDASLNTLLAWFLDDLRTAFQHGVEFDEPTISTAPPNDVDNPGYGFPGGGGLMSGPGAFTVGMVGPNGQWQAHVTNFQFQIIGDGELQLALATNFTVQKVWDQTTGAAPNVNVNSGGAIRQSTAVVALQADLEALELVVTALQAQVDAL